VGIYERWQLKMYGILDIYYIYLMHSLAKHNLQVFLGYKFWPISQPSSDLYNVKNPVKKTIPNPICLSEIEIVFVMGMGSLSHIKI
jgi:hypothetical protein